MKRKIITLVLLTVFSACSLFGAYYGGSNESRLYYLPRSVVDNKGSALPIASAKTVSQSEISVEYDPTTPQFSIFRISENLVRRDYSKLTDSYSGSLDMTITSQNGWNFIKEDNSTITRPFEINVYMVKKTLNNSSGVYSYQIFDASNKKVLTSTSYSTRNKRYTETEGNTSIFRKSGNSYILSLPYTTYYNDFASDYDNRYSTHYYEFDICIKLKDGYSNLPEGYYYTTITFSIPAFVENRIYINNSGEVHLTEYDENNQLIERTENRTITIWGYVGSADDENASNYSFYVDDTTDTYSMDLGLQTQPENQAYAVATAKFYNLFQYKIPQGEPVVEPDATTARNKFKIYISPTSTYTSEGRYQLIKVNAENQPRRFENTIYYDLYLKTSTGQYKRFSDLDGVSLADDANSIIGSAGVLNGVSSTYYITPKYTCTRTGTSTTSGGTTVGSDIFTQVWELTQTIYLRLEDESLSSAQNKHLRGLYSSTIYFTMVVE